jgi:uncharacterized protein (DUF1501 family)
MFLPDRRLFLRGGALAAVGFGVVPRPLLRAAIAAEVTRSRKTLVVVFQRGACDGLNTVIPYAEAAYRAARPSIAITPPGGGRANAAIDLDGRFGLHPALSDLKPLWDEGALAAIHAIGSPHSTRSHFDAQDFMETGTPGVKSTTDGWMNRAALNLGARPDRASGSERTGDLFEAVALSQTLPRVLRGAAPAVALARIEDFRVRDDIAMSEGPMARRRGRRDGTQAITAPAQEAPAAGARALEKLYVDGANDLLGASGRDTFAAVESLKQADPGQYRPRPGVTYPRGRLGEGLAQIAQLIKASLGVRLAFIDMGGWDHHAGQGGASGQQANLLRQLAAGMTAFHRDLGPAMNDVVLITMTEFGRTVRENGNRGTDHGHGSVSFVMGGALRGGRVHGRWPGISGDDLHEGRDLKVTTDFRDAIAEILSSHLNAKDLSGVFPRYEVVGVKGLFRT